MKTEFLLTIFGGFIWSAGKTINNHLSEWLSLPHFIESLINGIIGAAGGFLFYELIKHVQKLKNNKKNHESK